MSDPLADLTTRLRLLLEGIEAGTARFMSDYERAGDGVSRRIPGEAAAMIVAERSAIAADLRALLAAHTPPSEIRFAGRGRALAEAARVADRDRGLLDRLAGAVAPPSETATEARCGCTIGGLHKYACGLVGHVDPAGPSSSDAPSETATEIEDGFGGYWATCGPGCDLQVVRPGKVQCNRPVGTCPDRTAPPSSPDAPSEQGRCGSPCPPPIPPGAEVHCRLPHGHGGWHKGDDDSEWTPGPPSSSDAPDGCECVGYTIRTDYGTGVEHDVDRSSCPVHGGPWSSDADRGTGLSEEERRGFWPIFEDYRRGRFTMPGPILAELERILAARSAQPEGTERVEYIVDWLKNGPHPTRWTSLQSTKPTLDEARRLASYSHVHQPKITRRTTFTKVEDVEWEPVEGGES